MSGSSNLSSSALQWAQLRLRTRKPQTTASDGRLQGPSLQERRSLDPAKPQNPDSAFEVNIGLQVGGPTLKLANPGTGGKVFGLQYAIPIGYLAEVVNSTAKQNSVGQPWSAVDLKALEQWTRSMEPSQLHLLSPPFQKAVAQWAGIFPYLTHARIEDVLPADQSSWLHQALCTIREKYPHFPYPVPVEVQVLLWQAKAELGKSLLEPDADPAIFDAVITEEAKALAISKYEGLEPASVSPDAAAPAESDEDADIDPELARALRSFDASSEFLHDIDEDPLQRAAFEMQANAAQQTTPAGGSGKATPVLGFRNAACTAGLTEGFGTAANAGLGLASTTRPSWTSLEMSEIAQPHGRLVTSGMPRSIARLQGFNPARTVPPAPTVTASQASPASVAGDEVVDCWSLG